jgi:hypothetical protein
MNLWSPLEIEMLLKAYYSGVGVSHNLGKELVSEGLLEKDMENNIYNLSPKGEALVKMVLNTPMPVLKWTDPRI